MSWNFALHNINQTFEQIGLWYQDFMQRTEQSFRALHDRLVYLEEREAWRGPSDEQVERVLRKILSDKFSDVGVQRVEHPHALKNGHFFVERPSNDTSIPKPIQIDMAALQVDVMAVPSKEYHQTLQMLESEIDEYPHIDLGRNTQRDSVQSGVKDLSAQFKRPKQPSGHQQTKPWA